MSDEEHVDMAEPCTKAEVLKFLSTAVFQLAAPDVAHKAVQAGAQAVGWAVPPELLKALPAADTPAKGKGKKRKAKSDEEAGDAKKPRALSTYNLFNMLVSDLMAKDPTNPAFKVPSHTKPDGQVVTNRGAVMTMVGSCWKALGEEDKGTFNAIVQPAVVSINEAIAGGNKPENVLSILQEKVKALGKEGSLLALLQKSVRAGTGVDPGKLSSAAAAAVAPPPQPSSQPNGTAEKKKKKDKTAVVDLLTKPASQEFKKVKKEEKAEKAVVKAEKAVIKAAVPKKEESKKVKEDVKKVEPKPKPAPPPPSPPRSSSDDSDDDEEDEEEEEEEDDSDE